MRAVSAFRSRPCRRCRSTSARSSPGAPPFELPPNGIVNLGVGVPEGVASVANEEKVLQYITLSVESGAIGGIPASGASFGASLNMDAVIDENQQFDFYDGGGLDMACLGMAECDRARNVNVSRFGSRLIGVGGFINISQNARRMVFAGTSTAGGLEIAVEDGKLNILKEGKQKKFVEKVGQISFSGQYAYDRGRMVLYVTERCVFRRVRAGLAPSRWRPASTSSGTSWRIWVSSRSSASLT